MKWLWKLLPSFLFALAPVLFVYSHNVGQAWPSDLLFTVGWVIGVAAISLAAWLMVFRNLDKAALMNSIWLVLFFSYGHVFLRLAQWNIFSLVPMGPHLTLLAGYAGALVIALVVVWRATAISSHIHSGLLVMALAIIIQNLIVLVPFEIRRWQAQQRLVKYREEHFKATPITNTDQSTYPPIYYLVFDRYARQDMLAEELGFDNEPFISALEAKDLYVASQSAANYPATFQSLSSSLNMTYLDFLPEELGETYKDQTVVYEALLRDNKVARTLKGLGYRYVHIGDSWPPTIDNPHADVTYSKFQMFDEMSLFVYENTWINPIIGKLLGSQAFTGVRRLEIAAENLPYRIDQLQQEIISEHDQPQFVFGHFLLPHEPFLFDENCQKLPFDRVRTQEEEVGYLQQVECANSIILETVGSIKDHHPNAVVIIQSDEGPFVPTELFNGDGYRSDLPDDAFRMHAGIVNALYVPCGDQSFYPDQSPVNTFRFVFNKCFGSDYPLLEDRSFVFLDNTVPYQFKEITEIISSN